MRSCAISHSPRVAEPVGPTLPGPDYDLAAVAFNLLLAAVVLLGLVRPEVGLALDPARRWLVVAVMFVTALTLPGERLRRAAGNFRGLGSAFAVGQLALPLAFTLAARLLHPGDAAAQAGLVLLGALPCTLASATVWTRLAGGDDALALTYTVASNLLAVVTIPAVLLVALGSRVELPLARMTGDLVVVVLLPVAAGQLARRAAPVRAPVTTRAAGVIARGLILSIVLVAVSGSAATVRQDPAQVARTGALCVLLHVGALWLGAALARRLGAPREEQIAVAFAGAQKTLFVGAFLAGEYFPGAPLALLPVTAYHVLQLVLDTAVANRLARGGAHAV